MRRRPRRRVARRSRLRRAVETAGVVALLGLVAIAAAIFDELAMRSLSGPARAVDGDTLVLDGQRIRLAGLDAPELQQQCLRGGASWACGREARLRLAELVGEGDTECRGNERDRYGRLLMRCVCAGNDVNEAMVRDGWAMAYGDYGQAERAARSNGAGIWAGTFDRPSEWRARRGSMADVGPADLASRLWLRLRSVFGSTSDEENS